MSGGRTVWWAKDAAWWERERVVMLGETFGPAGPMVVDWLTCQAKKQNDGGRLRAGFRGVARGVFVDIDTVKAVVAEAVAIGFLDDFESEGVTFRCRVSGWAADQEIASAAVRQRRYRERLREEGVATGAAGSIRQRVFDRDGNRCLCCSATDDLVLDHVVPRSKGGDSEMTNLQTLCDGCNKDKGTSSTDYRDVTSRVTPVTECPPTGQDRTGQKSSSPTAQKTAKRATSRVDQSKAPDDFPAALLPAATDSLTILRRAWDVRGGVEPQPRGVALALLRQPKADHRQVAQGLEHWLTAGKGQRSKCDDIARRFGDWVADAPAADRGAPVVPLRRSEAVERADDWKRFYPQESAS